MEQYKIILESQLGPREGTLRLENQDGGGLKGTITLLEYENPVFGEWIGEHSIRLSHHLHTKISDLSCVSIFSMDGDTITGTLQNDWNLMKWHGEKASGKKGGPPEKGVE